ncbi:MAG TPA: gliding motility protein GldL [Prevotella sp.]
MTEYSKYNFVYRLQKWMDSVPGQTFLNYAYSWGASIVILGTLFKLTHLPLANVMLFIGMGTEVLVFFISAFDRPFDKTAEGRELPTRVTEEYLETGRFTTSQQAQGAPVVLNSITGSSATVHEQNATATVPNDNLQDNWTRQQQETSPELAEAQSNYIEELKKLTETLSKVSEQSVRLTRDSEEMENLNRTLTGISKVYEMQLKGASQQIGTIDQINEQSRRMAQQIEQLNKIYTRMIEAMTVNMKATTGAE